MTYPNFYDVKRGEITSPEYAGEYSVPLIEREDYADLVKLSHAARQEKIKNGEDTFKQLSQQKPNNSGFGFLTLPDLIDQNNKLLDYNGVNDAAYASAINGDTVAMKNLQKGMLQHSRSPEFLNIASQQQYFNEFSKQAEKIKDPNLKSQAFASIAAALTGEPDPTTGMVMKAKDFNIGHFAPMDLDKSIGDGLNALKTKNEQVVPGDGLHTVEEKSVINPEAGQQFIDAFTSNPAVQRNLTARGLGMTHVNGDKIEFELNEKGQKWIENILEAQTKPTTDIKSIKFNTKEFNTKGTRINQGLILDDLANASILTSDKNSTEGNQIVRRREHTFDEDLYRKNVGLKMTTDPAFRKAMLDQGFISEDGSFTKTFNETIDIYKKKSTKSEIEASKNMPKSGSASKSKSNYSNGLKNLKSAFEENGLELINVGGIDPTKKVNYRIIKGAGGKIFLRTGEGDKNDRELKEGVNFKYKKGPNNGPEEYKDNKKTDNKKPAKFKFNN